MPLSRIVFLLVLHGLTACASREVLEPKNAVAPLDVDFSGYWRLSADSPDARDRINADIGRAAGDDPEIIALPPEQERNRTTRTRPSRPPAGLVRVFLASGEHLKITQTPHGIFISYDRSVVREFRFGENRTVSVGQIVAQRVSGWVGDRYVAETLDKNGMKLTEELHLAADRQTLFRDITFRKADKSEVRIRQTFVPDSGLTGGEGEEPVRYPAGK